MSKLYDFDLKSLNWLCPRYLNDIDKLIQLSVWSYPLYTSLPLPPYRQKQQADTRYDVFQLADHMRFQTRGNIMLFIGNHFVVAYLR